MRRRWKTVGAVLGGFAALALAGMGLAAWMFAGWTELRSVSPEAAAREFSMAVAEAGGEPPYLEISPEGTVRLRRDLEGEEPAALARLHILTWEPDREKLMHMGLPFWFVRVKMNDAVNLGSITSALARDWENLDLKVSVEELERRGPGVILDHRLASGARVLLWTEGAAASAD